MMPAPKSGYGARRLVDSETANWCTVPNFLTISRLALTFPFLHFVLLGRDMEALLVFASAGLTDALDGFLARRFNQSSFLGRIADPFADKVLTCAAFVALAFFHPGPTIPPWVAIAAVTRDVLIVGGSIAVYTATHKSTFHPSRLGKLNTVVEILVVGLFLLTTHGQAASILLTPLYIITVISIVFSFLGYVLQGLTMYRPTP